MDINKKIQYIESLLFLDGNQNLHVNICDFLRDYANNITQLDIDTSIPGLISYDIVVKYLSLRINQSYSIYTYPRPRCHDFSEDFNHYELIKNNDILFRSSDYNEFISEIITIINNQLVLDNPNYDKPLKEIKIQLNRIEDSLNKILTQFDTK